MATATRRTTTKQSTSVKNDVKNETVDIKEPVIEQPVKQKRVFTDSDYILCRSVTSGGLNITSQSGNLYEFSDYGEECDINYRDLVTLIRRGSDHVFLPRFIILDDDFLEDFPTVKKVYGKMYTREDLEEILELPNSQMVREIEKLPNETREVMRNLIATNMANGKFDSISKARDLSKVFGSDFNLLSDLFIK